MENLKIDLLKATIIKELLEYYYNLLKNNKYTNLQLAEIDKIINDIEKIIKDTKI